jgi:CMD domain protein
MAGTDFVDVAAGLSPLSPVVALRRQRAAFVRHTQGSYDVLIMPADPAGVSLIERAAVALRVASIERDVALLAHYRARLEALGVGRGAVAAAEGGGGATDVPPRLVAILDHATVVTTAPGSASQARLDALRDVGLAPRDIVAIAQVVAFVSYQVRVVAGLRAMVQDTHA